MPRAGIPRADQKVLAPVSVHWLPTCIVTFAVAVLVPAQAALGSAAIARKATSIVLKKSATKTFLK